MTRTAASAERKRVRENNAAWIDAVAVRRRWLRENFLQRKAAPAGAELFVLGELLHGPHWLQEAMQRRHTVLAELLDIKPTSPDGSYGLIPGEFLTRIGDVSAKKATLHTAAVIFAAWERRAGDDDLGKQTWRRGSDDDRRILSQMVTGYPPSAVEELVLVEPETPDASDATPAAGDEDDPDGAGDEDRSKAGDEAGEQFVGGDVV